MSTAVMAVDAEPNVGIGATQRIADYICASRYDELPADVRQAAKLLILDTIACSIGGLRDTPARIILDYFRDLGGSPDATVLATGEKMPAPHAAYVNAFLGNLLDYDDTYRDLAHPGVTTILPAIAAAEKLGAVSGRDFINAVVVGYEVSLRVALAIAPSPARYDQVFGFTTHQVFGGSAAVAKLLRLDHDGVRRALGLAGVSAPVPHIHKNGIVREERPLTWQKGYGTSAMTGITAALLAAAGLEANRYIFDGQRGFWIMAGSDRCLWDVLVSGFGERYEILHSAVKPWPACRLIHPTLDAADHLRRSGICSADIEAVEVHTLTELAVNFGIARPQHLPDANFSLPYLVALVLADRNLQAGLSEELLRDEEVLALADRMTIVADPRADRAQHSKHRQLVSSVIVRLRNGEMHQHAIEHPKGAPENPLPSDDVVAKFRALAEPRLGEARCTQMVRLILDLEQCADVRELCRMAARKGSA